MQAKCDEEALVFLYTLTPRNSPKSFALNVARLAGIPSSITDRAKLKSESFFTVAESQRYYEINNLRLFIIILFFSLFIEPKLRNSNAYFTKIMNDLLGTLHIYFIFFLFLICCSWQIFFKFDMQSV